MWECNLTMHLNAMLVLVDLYVHLLEQTRRRQGLHRARIDRDVAQGRCAARHAGQRTPRQVDMMGRPQDKDALDALRVQRLVRVGCRRATVAVPDVGEVLEGGRSRRKSKGGKAKTKHGKHSRVQSYGGAYCSPLTVTEEPTAFSVWIPGVGYVMDPCGTYHATAAAAGVALTTPVQDLHMSRVSSVDSNLSGISAVSSDKDARRRRRREEQRRNRSKSNRDRHKDHDKDKEDDTASQGTASTCASLGDDIDGSLISSSPSMSYSSPSSSYNSTRMHSRNASGIGFGYSHSLQSSVPSSGLESSLPPDVLASLLSMATW